MQALASSASDVAVAVGGRGAPARDDETLRAARAAYFARSGFDDRTYVEDWAKLPVGPFTLRMPNIAARKEAVRLHDLNHVVTGYATDWMSEFEISAFELGAGCGRYWIGWVINSGGVAAGLVRQPRRTLAAYARGRASRQSIYRHVQRWDDAILDDDVGSLKRALGIPAAAEPTLRDALGAVAYATFGLAVHLAPVVVVAGLVAWAARAWLG